MNQDEEFFKNYQGAFDNRTPEQKEKDFNQKEIVASVAAVNWIKKKKSQFRSFPSLNQNYTNKCVAFTLRKIAGILYFLKTGVFFDFSASFPYEYRINKPSGGMVGTDAFDIWRKNGMTPESLCPSGQTYDSDEVKIDEMAKQVALGFISGGDVGIDAGDFDSVCSTIQETKKGIMTWFFFTHDEWSQSVPKIIETDMTDPGDARASRHSVSSIDFGIATDITEINGEQVIKIEDSAHFGSKDVRYITREFFNKRCWFIRYPMNFKFDAPKEGSTKPIYTFTKTMKFSSTYSTDPEVVALQNCLKWSGFFPSNSDSTGYFGSVTKKAVIAFQTKYGLTPDGVVGPITRSKLNELFSK